MAGPLVALEFSHCGEEATEPVGQDFGQVAASIYVAAGAQTPEDELEELISGFPPHSPNSHSVNLATPVSPRLVDPRDLPGGLLYAGERFPRVPSTEDLLSTAAHAPSLWDTIRSDATRSECRGFHSSSFCFDHGDSSPPIALNVGDEIFETTAATLRRAPFFESMLRLSADGQIGTSLDACGRYFVDRPGDRFRFVLNYLRSGRWASELTRDAMLLDAIREEATFYGLDPGMLPRLSFLEYAVVWQFREDTAIYVDCDEQTLREDPDLQGAFRLCKYCCGLPLDAKTVTRRFKASSHSVASVLNYFGRRGWSLRHVVEDSMITHVTSADGQSRVGRVVQYVLTRGGCAPEPGSQRPYPAVLGGQEC